MRRVTRHLRVGIVGTMCALLTAFPAYAAATADSAPAQTVVSAPDVFITEFQTNGGSASQEFVELYNGTDHDINFGDSTSTTTTGDQWKLEFFNSSAVKTGAPAWTTAATTSNSVTLSGMVSAHDYYLLASTNYLPGGITPDAYYAPSSSHLMTDTGGGLQLLSVSGSPSATTAHDRIIWLAPTAGTALPAGVLASPTSGKSLQRLPNDDNEYVQADNSLTAFSSSADISPLDAWQALAPVTPPATDPTADDDGSDTGDDTTAAVDNTGLAAPQITELLPNPASPLTDAADEFIELYNPNNAVFDLKGYSLEVGITTLHVFTFGDDTILAPDGYQAFYSADTKLALSNSGSQVRLCDTAGTVISQSAVYGTAADNQSWMIANGTWQWSTAPTPGLANIVALPLTATKATAKATTTKAATVKKATTTKAATTKKAKGTTTTKKAAKKTTKKKAATKTTALSTAASITPKAPIHTGILVGVAIAAVLYGLYEYRHDISNKFRQLRDNRRHRGTDGDEIAWRGGYSADQ